MAGVPMRRMTDADIRVERQRLAAKHGSEDTLRRKLGWGTITAREADALDRLEGLDYLGHGGA